MVQLKQILGLGSLAFLSFGCAQLECKNEDAQSQSIVQDRIQRRSLEVGTWFMPQVMYKSMARGSIDNFNGDELTVFYFSKPMNYKSQLVTGNNNSPYVHLFHNLKKTGPVVVDFPAAGDEGAFFGTFLDSWHKPIVDVGPDGADKGEGGKYFIYGPDFEGKVPKGYILENFKLGTWVLGRRRTKLQMPSNQKQRLNQIGFIWDPLAELWEESFRKLQEFRVTEGHCRVPAIFKLDGFKLGAWVGTQRRAKDRLPPERKKRLDDIGFIWDASKDKT